MAGSKNFSNNLVFSIIAAMKLEQHRDLNVWDRTIEVKLCSTPHGNFSLHYQVSSSLNASKTKLIFVRTFSVKIGQILDEQKKSCTVIKSSVFFNEVAEADLITDERYIMAKELSLSGTSKQHVVDKLVAHLAPIMFTKEWIFLHAGYEYTNESFLMEVINSAFQVSEESHDLAI